MQIKTESEQVETDKNLGPALTMTQTSPEEAAQNISRANLFEITPDSYKGLKTQLDPEAETIERMPAQVPPATQEYLKQSEQHAALGKEDVSIMSKIENRLSYYKQQIFELPTLNREINELRGRQIVDGPDSLDEGEKEQLRDLNLAVADIEKNNEANTDIGGTEKFITEVGSAVVDLGRSYTENLGILATGVGGGAAVGALAGSFVPGLGTAAGATAGAVKGTVAASTVIGFLDGYTQTRDGLYNQLALATNEKGEPLNLPHERMAMVSQGVGLIAGVAGGVAGKVLATGNPFLKRFASPKLAAKLMTGSPAIMARMEILGGIGKSVLAEGGEEGLQELIQIMGANFAKMDETEASFENALNTAIEVAQQTFTAENLSQVGYAAAVGGATGGAIQSTMGAAGYKGLKGRYEEVQQVSQKRAEVLQAQNTMLEVAEQIKNTKMNKVAPEEMNSFTRKIFSTIGLDENVFFQVNEIDQFVGEDPAKAAAVQRAIDPSGELTKLARQMNTPLEINRADVLQVITEFPDLADYMRLQPDGENPLEVRQNAKNFVDRLGEAETQRNAIMQGLELDSEMPAEIQERLAQASKLTEDRTEPYTGKNDYLESQSFIEIPGIIEGAEAERFNSAHLDATLAVAQSLKQDVDDNFERINNRIFRDVDAKDIQNDIVKLDSEFKVLERFTDRTTNAVTVEHKKKGFSASAIDWRTVPEDLRAIYGDNEKLAKRKVFVDGGIDLEESAVLNGVDTGAELLRILAETPSRNEVKKTREQRQIQLRNRIEQTTKPAKVSARDAAFSNLTRIYTKEMEYMKSKEWATTKRGIVKIALSVPTIEGLNAEAKAAVLKTRVRDLNPQKFKVGERNSQRASLKNFLDGKFEQAFKDKEMAALNNEYRKETINAAEKVAKMERFWKKVTSPSIQQELKDAGMSKAMDNFLDVYRLDGVTRGETEQNAFNNWIKKQVNEGNYTPVVPERLDNIQMSSKDLTLEQYQTITEMGEHMVHEAKMKNKLLRAAEDRKEIRTAEMIAQDVDKHARENVNFDDSPSKVEGKAAETLSTTEAWWNGLKTSVSAVSSIKTIISELDGYQLNGYFHNLIGKPIKEARNAKRQEIYNIESHDKKLIEQFYGIGKFKDMFNNYIAIPEFANIASLGDGAGNIRKVDLLVLQAYMGDPEGREAMANFVTRDGKRLDAAQVQTILNRELDSNDAAFTQNFLIDRWKGFEQRSFDLHKKTTGIDAEMVKGVPFVHNDKVLPGGYYPIKRRMVSDEIRASNYLESVANKVKKFAGDSMSILGEGAEGILGTDESAFYARMRSAEMTQQGRLKERTGSERPLDIRFENVFDFTEEVVHDLSFREVGIDTLKILKNPLNVKNIKAVVGPKKFTNLLNGVKDVVSKTTERESTLFGEEYTWLNGIIQKAHSLHAIKTIGLNLTSAAIQADSLSTLALRIGPKSAIYLGKTAAKIGANLSNYEHYVNLAEQINPDIRFEKDGIDNAIVKSSYDFIPSGRRFFSAYNTKSGDFAVRLKDLQQKGINASFSLVRESDKFNKVLTTMAVSEMFLNGDVDGFNKAKVDSMSDAEKATAMRSVVQQAIDLSLTASAPEDKTPLEKTKVGNIFTRYWTDRRSRLNSTLAQVDKIKGSIKRGENAKAAGQTLTLAVAAGASAAFINIVRDNADSIINRIKGVGDEEEAEEFAISLAWDFVKAPVSQTLDTIPFIDAIKYQTEVDVKSDYRNVSAPLWGVGSDIASGVVIMREMLNMAVSDLKKGKGLKVPEAFDDETQRKFLLTNAGYLLGGAPTNGALKALDSLNSNEVKSGGKYLKQNIMDLNKEIKSFINHFGDDKDAEVFIQDIKEYQKTLPQFDDDVKNVIPENTKEQIKEISSGGQWDKVDDFTGAAGIYQFTEERWTEIMSLNPELGLTENGRVAKDPEQQERAMQWELQDNTRGLMAYEIPVDTKNLLGAHKFGFDNYASIYSAKDDEKLSDLLGDEASLPILEKFTTVKQVKNYLAKQVKNQ